MKDLAADSVLSARHRAALFAFHLGVAQRLSQRHFVELVVERFRLLGLLQYAAPNIDETQDGVADMDEVDD